MKVTVWRDPDAAAFEVSSGVSCQTSTRLLGARVVTRHVEVVSLGPVEAVVRQSNELADGGRVVLILRIVAGNRHVLVDEHMTGFAKDDDRVRLVTRPRTTEPLAWRVGPNRPVVDPRGAWFDAPSTVGAASADWEPVDARLRDQGMLDLELRPYHNWWTFWRLPWVGFWGNRAASGSEGVPFVGVFVGDAERWDDGRYALWGSANTLAVGFRWVDGDVQWEEPVRTGSRQIGIVVGRCLSGSDPGVTVWTVMADTFRWSSWLPVSKVARWHLGHREPQQSLAPVFPAEYHQLDGVSDDRANASALRDWLTNRLHTLVAVPSGGPRSPDGPTPVDMRPVLGWVAPLFDEAARDLDRADFYLAASSLQFLAYLCRDEWLMPTRRMLAGHPNFLTEVLTQVAILPLLFPRHPDAQQMADHVEQATAMNVRRHTRPAVAAWRTDAGRWTESPGVYCWHNLEVVTAQSAYLRRHFDGRNRLSPPEFEAMADWLISTLSVPLRRFEGRRAHPAQGAHAHASPPPAMFRAFGAELDSINPLLAEHVLWSTPPSDDRFKPLLPGEYDHEANLTARLAERRGVAPRLSSRAFTGYGFVLRTRAHRPDEAVVVLQQLDDGPNYRWGRAAGGGNGVIYYSAAGERWSHNSPERVGDGPYGDVEFCTNFGVRAPAGYRDLGEYRAVGRNELTRPMIDLEVAQFAQVDASPRVAEWYLSRSVLMVGADYLVILDHVPDPETEGRFSWFVDADVEFPSVVQLKPGIQDYVEKTPELDPRLEAHRGRYPASKGRSWTGCGTFLTLVSHRHDLTATSTDWGAWVERPDGTDAIVRSPDGMSGTLSDTGAHRTSAGVVVEVEAEAAVVRWYDDRVELALARGHRITASGLEMSTVGPCGVDAILVRSDSDAGPQRARGMIAGTGGSVTMRYPDRWGSLYLDGLPITTYTERDERRAVTIVVDHPARWEITAADATPNPVDVVAVDRAHGHCMIWVVQDPAVDGYLIEISADGIEWRAAGQMERGAISGHTRLPAERGWQVRIRGRRGAAISEPGAAFPMPHGDAPPPAPDGLTLSRREDVVVATWGRVLGSTHSRLYRRHDPGEEWELLATVEHDRTNPLRPRPSHTVEVDGPTAEFAVSSMDGYGEGPLSASAPARLLNTELGQLLDQVQFERWTESHESGYQPEYDPWVESNAPILTYPQNTPTE